MHIRNKPTLPTLALLLSALAVVSARGAGFDLPDQDAFAIARGMAVVATADNPSAIYYNPAGITQIPGNNVRGGLYGLYFDPSYENAAGEHFDNEKKLHALPQFYATHAFGDTGLTAGLGIYSPFGLSIAWPPATGFRTVAESANLNYYTINPVIALKALPSLSVAGGITVDYAKADIHQGLLWPTQNNDDFRFVGDGWDVGYNLGALWQPDRRVSIGVNFRSTTRIDLQGHTDANVYETPPAPLPPVPPLSQRTTADASFNFPLKAIFGLSYRPTPAWNLEFDADYTDWSALQQVTIHQAAPVPPILPQDIPLTLDWQASMYYEFGATYYFTNGWNVSGGYIYSQSSVPDSHFTPFVADTDRSFFSVGVGHKTGHWTMDLAYQLGYGAPDAVTGSAASATGQTADGTWRFFTSAFAVSVGYGF